MSDNCALPTSMESLLVRQVVYYEDGTFGNVLLFQITKVVTSTGTVVRLLSII